MPRKPQELQRLGWVESELPSPSKRGKDRVASACRPRTRTVTSLAWIAEHLRIWSWSYVSNLFHQQKVQIVRTDKH